MNRRKWEIAAITTMAKKSKPLIGTGKCGTGSMGPGFGEVLHEEMATDF